MSSLALEKKKIATSFGRIAYLETGSSGKPAVLFVHGIPTSGYLWRHVIRLLGDDFHCYAPDLMGLGDTEADPAAVPFHMDNQAEMLLEFMTALGHETFGLVCHDQGGAACQIIAARQPDRIDCFVLTNCVCYDNWPVPEIRRLQRMLRVPLVATLMDKSGLGMWLQTNERTSAFKRGMFDPSKLENNVIAEYLRPTRTKQGAARFKAFALAGDPRYTKLAVPGLKKFDKPTIVIWGADDNYLSPSWGRKLFDEIPGARMFELVAFCGHFWQEERPSEFASIMGKFLAAHLGSTPTPKPKLNRNDDDRMREHKSLPMVASTSATEP